VLLLGRAAVVVDEGASAHCLAELRVSTLLVFQRNAIALFPVTLPGERAAAVMIALLLILISAPPAIGKAPVRAIASPGGPAVGVGEVGALAEQGRAPALAVATALGPAIGGGEGDALSLEQSTAAPFGAYGEVVAKVLLRGVPVDLSLAAEPVLSAEIGVPHIPLVLVEALPLGAALALE
jgi:hypothetical protein